MAFYTDVAATQNPHVNYEPSGLGGLHEAPAAAPEHRPWVEGHLVRQPIDRPNNYGQAGERFRAFEEWEREELIANLVAALSICTEDCQDRMLWHCAQADADYGRRLAAGLGRQVPQQLPDSLRHLDPNAVRGRGPHQDPRGDSITSPQATGERA